MIKASRIAITGHIDQNAADVREARASGCEWNDRQIAVYAIATAAETVSRVLRQIVADAVSGKLTDLIVLDDDADAYDAAIAILAQDLAAEGMTD